MGVGVKFRAGELEVNATIAESSEARSPQTGNVLRSLTIQFRAQKAGMHEAAVTQALERQSGGLYSVGDADQPEMEWRVRESTWTYIGSEPWGVNHHVWRIEEVERLACTLLSLAGIALQPYDYAERASNEGVVALAARALVSEADLEALSRLSRVVEVVRVGISEAPRRMSFEYVWGERPEGPAVVVRCEDLREPRITLDRSDVSDVDTLVSMLDDDEFRRRRHAHRHVANPDAWPL